jgi:hypothetical protein
MLSIDELLEADYQGKFHGVQFFKKSTFPNAIPSGVDVKQWIIERAEAGVIAIFISEADLIRLSPIVQPTVYHDT